MTDIRAELGATLHRFDNVEFDEQQGLLRVAGELVDVEPRPLRVLAELLQKVNEVVTKDELMDSVWEGRPTVEHVLANAISKLRNALGATAAERIKTVPRVGYRLAGPVQRVDLRAVQHSLQVGQPVVGREGFVLEPPLGQGARHDVWLARHAKLGHAHVFKFADDGARLSALKREYTLYRVLKQELGPRDDFASVIGSNFVSAPYFLECEFGGQSLLEWAEDDGHLKAMPQAERLGLFLQIARAVAAAHSVGVLHKDIKPGNVLIDGGPEKWQARLTDFGSGRLLDPSRLAELKLTALGLTQTQEAQSDSRSGTVMYMAPEVMQGQAPTVQSDVYSLGVLLFQIVVGDLQRPMATGWQRAVSDEILLADIEATTEGLYKDRTSSAAALVDGLEKLETRHRQRDKQLVDDALTAQIQTESHRRKARRPWALAGLGGIVVGLLVSTGMFITADRARLRALDAQARAQAMNEFLSKDILQSADITGLGSKKSLLLGEVLSSASSKVKERFQGLPQTEAGIRNQLGELHFRLGNSAAAAVDFEAALALSDRPQDGNAMAAVEAAFGLAQSLVNLRRTDEAAVMIKRADSIGLSLNGIEAIRARRLRAKAQTVYFSEMRDNKSALAAARELVSSTDQLPGESLQSRFTVRRRLAEILLRNELLDEAEVVLNAMMSAPFTPQSVGELVFSRAQVQIARLNNERGHSAEAERILLVARDAMAKRLGERDLSLALLNQELGVALADQGKWSASHDAWNEAREAATASVGPDSEFAHSCAVNMARAKGRLGKSAEALDQLAMERAWYARQSVQYASPWLQLIDYLRTEALLNLGRGAEAEPLLAGLEAKKLNAVHPSPYWSELLKAETARLYLLKGQRVQGQALLADAVLGMTKLGAKGWETERLQRLLVTRQ